jgi:transcriptional regulator with XRE-family HTH domain
MTVARKPAYEYVYPGTGDSATNPLAIAFGARVREHRMKLGLSQEELGERAMLHRTAISLIERGLREPGYKVIIRLAGSLEIDVDTLAAGLFEYDSPPPKSQHKKGPKVAGRFVPTS